VTNVNFLIPRKIFKMHNIMWSLVVHLAYIATRHRVEHRSKNETVRGFIEKVQNLKQNRAGYCFKAWTLVHFKRLFQKLDLDSGEFFEWGTN